MQQAAENEPSVIQSSIINLPSTTSFLQPYRSDDQDHGEINGIQERQQSCTSDRGSRQSHWQNAIRGRLGFSRRAGSKGFTQSISPCADNESRRLKGAEAPRRARSDNWRRRSRCHGG